MNIPALSLQNREEDGRHFEIIFECPSLRAFLRKGGDFPAHSHICHSEEHRDEESAVHKNVLPFVLHPRPHDSQLVATQRKLRPISHRTHRAFALIKSVLVPRFLETGRGFSPQRPSTFRLDIRRADNFARSGSAEKQGERMASPLLHNRRWPVCQADNPVFPLLLRLTLGVIGEPDDFGAGALCGAKHESNARCWHGV